MNGVWAGLSAGIPVVLLTQIEAWLLPVPWSHADIGPRLVERVENLLASLIYARANAGIA